MCGISGIIKRDNSAVDFQQIKNMNDSIRHRGPDGEGFFMGNNFAFGHRRLSILDLSEDGSQPMEYQSENIIVFNGEVYNYIELREELKKKGYTFNTHTDTEVLLAAYDFWGEKCVERLNGMWSFVIFDKKQNKLFASRDRFGVKPFYYVLNEEVFAFGSEIRQLIPFLKETKVNRQVLLDYLIIGMEEYTNDTFFQNILKLEQGSNLVYDLSTHEYRIFEFYSLKISEKHKSISEKQAVDLYENQLNESVTLRMRSDVEVGVCLSGGLDSSSITALSSQFLRNISNDKIKAIHAKVDEKQIDESNFAIKVAEHTDSELILVQPKIDDFISSIDEVIQTQEEPFGSPSIILQHFVLKEARKRKCLVMLDGQGGDETLLGYERYYPAFLLKKKGLQRIKEFINSSKNSKLSKTQLIKYFVYFTNYKQRIKYLKKRNNFIKTNILNKFESPILKELTSKYKDIDQLQKLEIKKTQLPHLLKYEDKNSMANSVETRLPFLDYRCVELAISLPNEYKIKEGWTKNVLRKAIDSHLPKEIVWRKDKLGFNAPEKKWLDAYKLEMKRVIDNSGLLNEIINKNNFNFESLDLRTQWRLFNIAKWEQIFNVKW